MAERHFWQIDIFLLKEFLVKLMIWLDAPYNTLEIHGLRIFLSSSYELWRVSRPQPSDRRRGRDQGVNHPG